MRFQAKARTNWGELIVSSVVDRIVPNGLTVKGDSKVRKPLRRNGSIATTGWTRSSGLGSLRPHLTQSYLTCWRGGTASR